MCKKYYYSVSYVLKDAGIKIGRDLISRTKKIKTTKDVKELEKYIEELNLHQGEVIIVSWEELKGEKDDG